MINSPPPAKQFCGHSEKKKNPSGNSVPCADPTLQLQVCYSHSCMARAKPSPCSTSQSLQKKTPGPGRTAHWAHLPQPEEPQQRKSFAKAKPHPSEQAPTSENSVHTGKTKEACGTYVGTKGCWMRNTKKGGGGKRGLIQGSVQKLALLGNASPTGSRSPEAQCPTDSRERKKYSTNQSRE